MATVLATSDGTEGLHGWQRPLEVVSWNAAALRGLTPERLAWGFVWAALVVRFLRFLLRSPLWPDEAFLAVSLLDRGYLQLLEPLEYRQVAPFLFMWVQLAVVQLFGFNEWSLRLFSFVCGAASLFLFYHLARRLLSGAAFVWAVAVFAVAYPLFRYSSEAKPYGSDVLVTLVLATLAVRWWQAPHERRWAWLLMAVTPVCVFLSYPAVFVGGGVSLALAASLVRTRDLRGGLIWVGYNLLLVGSFVALFLLSAHRQAEVNTYMLDCWAHTFPPTDSVGRLAEWLVRTHASDALSYPVGGPNFASSLTLVWCLCGVALLWSRRHLPLALLCLAPAALNLAAAALHKYPYGGHVRFALYAAPCICLLVGLGAMKLLELVARTDRWRQGILAGGLALFAVILGGETVVSQMKPYKTEEFLNARNLAQWFWSDMAARGELVCIRNDLGFDLRPGTFADGKSCLYLCNQKIYSKRHATGEAPAWEKISREWPLLCVEYRQPKMEVDVAAHERWLQEMQSRYELVAEREIPEGVWDDRGRNLTSFHYLHVYEFVPRGPKPVAAQPATSTLR